jgi:pyruvate/2-oxoglutarate dehydrogenase complex dihydrolipoamide dehydrogenase (E3) component
VTVIEVAPRLIPREDEDVSAAAAGILNAEGIGFHVGASDLKLAKRRNDIVAPSTFTRPCRSCCRQCSAISSLSRGWRCSTG